LLTARKTPICVGSHAAFPSVRIIAALSTKHAAIESLAKGTCDLATIAEAVSAGNGFAVCPARCWSSSPSRQSIAPEIQRP